MDFWGKNNSVPGGEESQSCQVRNTLSVIWMSGRPVYLDERERERERNMKSDQRQSWITKASKAVGESLDLIINGSGSYWKV